MGDHFYTSPYTAIGRDSFSPPSWGWGFSYHEVAWSGGCQDGDCVYDDCLRFDDTCSMNALGSYRLDIEYVANWHADAWVLGSNGVYSRNVWSYFSIRFFGNNGWDFKWNENYTLWENITQELIPGAIAGSIGNPADYDITYEFWGNYYISVKQYMD